MIEVVVQRAVSGDKLPGEAEITRWAEAALGDRPGNSTITVRLVDEAEGHDLNQRYRGKDYATNVLSFTADIPAVHKLPDLGDLVLCAPVIEREAEDQGKALADHWAHLVVHGVLHLLGYDHEAPADAATMEAAEISILGKLGIADPY
jgi:probable rRNA maturation factor